jgi:hypothetical protein
LALPHGSRTLVVAVVDVLALVLAVTDTVFVLPVVVVLAQ